MTETLTHLIPAPEQTPDIGAINVGRYGARAAIGSLMVGADGDAGIVSKCEMVIPKNPITRIEVREGVKAWITPLADFAPSGEPSNEPFAVPDYLEEIIKGQTGGRYTYENTVSKAGWEREVRSVVDRFTQDDQSGRAMLEKLEITSLDQLTPSQAVHLSVEIVRVLSKYSRDDVGRPANTRADTATTAELLQEGIAKRGDVGWGGNGVCRNIASNTKAVFEALKATQGDQNMLRNTYAVYNSGIDGDGYADSRKNPHLHKLGGSTSGHAWNTFVTIEPNGSSTMTIADATWALDNDQGIHATDRTLERAIGSAVSIFEHSEDKTEAFRGLDKYLAKLMGSTSAVRAIGSQRSPLREAALTEYLRIASTLPEIPDCLSGVDTVMTAAVHLRGKVSQGEIKTLYNLDTANGELERGRIEYIIKSYDLNRVVRHAEGLIFEDDGLQALAIKAVGTDRATELADRSGDFRRRVRRLQPDLLPAFDITRPADTRELGYIMSMAGVNESSVEGGIRSMRRRIGALAGNDDLARAIMAGRSDYDLAVNYPEITRSLEAAKRKAAN